MVSDVPEAKDGGLNRRLFIVANRHPVTVKRDTKRNYTFSKSSGGLVTGLSGLPRSLLDNSKYYGWPGLDVPEEEMDIVIDGLKDQKGVPIWVDGKLMDLHYNGYSNMILWPLFHYHANEMTFEEGPWEAYIEVNRIFAQKVAEDVQDNDIVWVHDYHLMLAPQMIREELVEMNKEVKNLKIGFFLHIPFPSSQEFFKLPYREVILTGLLHSDLVGFHTYDYARHFLSACSKVLHLETTPNGVRFGNQTIHVGAFPIGIDPSKEMGAMQDEKVINEVKRLKEGSYKDRSVIVSVDRLDYIKGLPHKFHAIDMFLETYPNMRGKVVLMQIVIPSRQDVKEYQILRSHISELAGRINAKYGTFEYQPIIYRYTTVPHWELCSIYAMSDTCLVTSTRDGMNLVSYEYIACHEKTHGQLVISEFAGAAQSMKGCITINPWDTGNIVEALHQAITMSPEQKEVNWKKMFEYVSKYTSANWGISFIDEIVRIGGGDSDSRAVAVKEISDSSLPSEYPSAAPSEGVSENEEEGTAAPAAKSDGSEPGSAF